MARLNSPPEKYGTYDGICLYHMNDDDFMRKASSLTGKRVKSDPAFEKTMTYAQRMATAGRLAGAVYGMLSPSRRKHPFYRVLTGKAMRWLNEGKTEAVVVVDLMLFIRLPKRKPRKKRATGMVIKLTRKNAVKTLTPQQQQWSALSPSRVIELRCVDPATAVPGYYGCQAIRHDDHLYVQLNGRWPVTITQASSNNEHRPSNNNQQLQQPVQLRFQRRIRRPFGIG